MNCESNVEKLMDCARRRGELSAAVKVHLRTCERCLDRWEAERELSENLRFMRMQAAALRSPATARESLMREFELRHTRLAPLRPFRPGRILELRCSGGGAAAGNSSGTGRGKPVASSSARGH